MKRILLSVFLFVLIQHVNAQSVNIYVSPTGNDRNQGFEKNEPLANLQQALDVWAGIKKSGKTDAPVNIFLEGGTYRVEKPVTITPENCGTPNSPINIRCLDGKKAIFDGSKKISGWKKYKNNIWMAPVPEAKSGTWNFNQLYVNGKAKVLARYPNEGFYIVTGFPDGGEEIDYHKACKRFEFKKGDINPAWKNMKDIRVIVYHFWTDTHLVIDTIDSKTNIVTFKYEADKRFTDDFSNEGARYIVENVFEGLDTPGEWFLDRHKGIVYYIPMAGEDMTTAEIKAPVSKEFLRLVGNPLSNKVEHVTIQNIAFEYSNFILPENDANDNQASVTIPASVTAKGASNIEITNCSFSHLGNFAFDIQSGCSNIKVTNNTLHYLAAGAFKINGGTERDHPLERTKNIIISDNEIGHYGQSYPSAVGILLRNAEGCYIGHNHIYDGWYTGISIGWEWGYQQSISRNNIIEYNYIHNIGQGLLSDMGGIYTLGVSPGTVIRNNLIHDVESNKYGGWGIYNDEGSTHILIENNIVYNTKYAAYDIHYAKELTVRNNIFALGRLEELNRGKMEPHQSVYFTNNIVYWKTLKDPFTGNWKDEPFVFHQNPNSAKQPTFTKTFTSDYNIFFNPLIPNVEGITFNGKSWSDWHKSGNDTNSLYTDPMFVNPEKFDFTLNPESPAFKLGFHNIDMKEVGPRNK